MVDRRKQANIHTLVRNEVTLVWGSLRLALVTENVEHCGGEPEQAANC